MYSEDEERVLNMSLHKRRLSLFEKLHVEVQSSQRQQIRNRCKQFIHSRKKAYDECPISPETSIFAQTEPTQRSMPSIRQIREQRHLVGQTLRKTISRYNYINNEKFKKLQAFQRKKTKFEKVLKIRQQHSIEKKRLTESLISLHNEDNEQKLKLKHSVDVNRAMATQSRISIMNKNKMMGDERRQQIFLNKSRISRNKTQQIETNKKMHGQIVSEQKNLKVKKKQMSQFQRRAGVKQYCEKLRNQIQRFSQIDKYQIVTNMQLSSKIGEIEKSKEIYTKKLKEYQSFLKDGSTLRKTKLNLKPKQEGVKNSAKTNSVSYELDNESIYD